MASKIVLDAVEASSPGPTLGERFRKAHGGKHGATLPLSYEVAPDDLKGVSVVLTLLAEDVLEVRLGRIAFTIGQSETAEGLPLRTAQRALAIVCDELGL